VIAVIVLDTGPLGLLTNPNRTAGPVACRQWLSALQAAGRRVIIPEIADYEIRRELIRANLQRAIRFLDNLHQQLEYLPITTLAMRLAADLWAQARNAGVATAGGGSLDGDVILAGQATALNVAVVVATGNPVHLSRFVPAELWSNVRP
jgi:hypothetical protein